MFENSEKFPEGWFFIKNNSNGYVLMADNESQESGSHIVLSTLRTKDYNAQLWRHDPQGYLVNKKSGQVMDVAKGTAKAGVDIVQQVQSTNIKEDVNFQKFGLSPYGHIYLTNKPSLILGIKESFFARREGLHVHLQLVDKRHLDRKEQRWDFVLPIVKERSAEIQRSASSSTVKSVTPSVKLPAVAQIKEDDARSVRSTAESCTSLDQDEANAVPTGSFPDTPFFLKSDASGLYVSIENATSVSSGTQLTIEALRKKAYDSQLWTYEKSSHRIVNKFSGLVLGIEHDSIKDGSDICQTKSSADKDKTQAWILSQEGELTLKNDTGFVIGFKESWFGNREGAHLHLQKRNRGHNHQKFTVVLPLFKKSTETSIKTEQRGVFPNGWFFVKSQARGLVLTVLETGVIAAEVAAAKLDTSNYSRQLWKYNDGYIINKASEMVLDIRGGSIASGAKICQYKQKHHDNQNQQWALSPEGIIFPQSNKNLVLTVKESETVRSTLYLSERRSTGHKEQCWNFVLPVFKKKTNTVTKIDTFKYATYPSGWFFVRSYVYGSTTESPLVLTAHEKSVELHLLDRNNWQYQLWTYSSGKLINYATDFAIDVSSFAAGADLIQNATSNQKWYMTVDGYLIYGSSDSKLALSVETQSKDKYRLTLSAHKYSQELRWGFLIPKFKYRSGVQILSQWSISILREWRSTTTTSTSTIKKINRHPVAEWPEDEFYIGGPDGHALAPEKSESGSTLIMKKLDIESSSVFKWVYKNGYLVHCATGLVMRAQDKFSEGARLKLSTEAAGDIYQSWTLRTDGSIMSKKDEQFGLGLVQINGVWTIQISTTSYYSWRVLYGRYELRYSEKEKKEVSYLVSFQRIVLSIWTYRKTDNVERKLVTHSYGVFPKGWIFIRSKCDDNLLITVSDKKKGAKLVLSKLDSKIYRRQLWRYRDDGCLVNFDTDYVIDVAGGKLLSNANIIQWSPKFLRSSRKNQMWGLSVDGHLHPQSSAELVLSSVGNHAKEGAELKLVKRGDLSLDYQQWTFAFPVFGKCAHTSYSAQQANKDSLVLEKVGSTYSMEKSSSERYERVTKTIITRRWGIFPEGGFFIRCAHGSKNLALTVEKDESVSTKYKIVVRSLNFKQYKWQLWTYRDGHLYNEETGLVLDAQFSEDIAVEEEQDQVYLKEKASNEGQFWDLGADGEIHLRSNQRLAIGVSSSDNASVEGAQVTINKIKTVRTNVDGKQTISLKSEQWLRWSFSKPVFGKRSTESSTAESSEGELSIEKCEEETVKIKEEDEELDEDEEEEENQVEEAEKEKEEEEEEFEIQTPIQTPSSSTGTSNAAGVAIVTAGTVVAIAAGASAAVNVVSSHPDTEEKTQVTTITTVDSSIKTDLAATVETSNKINAEVVSGSSEVKSDATAVVIDEIVSKSTEVASPTVVSEGAHITSTTTAGTILKKSNSSKVNRLSRKDSFQLEENYVPTGYEKIVRYKTHHNGFPSGYFFIKSSLHGYVLDVVGDVNEGVYAVLTRMKSTDFASQLWSYQNGFLVNLKGRTLVLDAATSVLAAGERAHLSARHSKIEGAEDQIWEYGAEKCIYLKAKRSLVLSLKETHRSDAHTQIEVYVQESKSLVKKEARPEQHWEVLIPALIPVSQGESGVKIIESGKVEKVTSSASAIVSYKWLKETYCHKVTSQNQWPGTEGWFFIRFGVENHFIASGESAQSQVGLYEISNDIDYRRFLWTYIDGYLVNYRYMLRLILSTSHKWVLSNSHSTLNQKFYISSNGSISVRISKIIYYIRFIRSTSGSICLGTTSDSDSKDVHGLELHIPVISDADYQQNSISAISSAYSWVHKQKSDWSIISNTVAQRGIFPVSTWFFIKVSGIAEDLALSVQENSSQLVLKKLDFKSFKNQLWTYNDGLLINYGSKFVIDVQGSVSIDSKIITSAEAGVSSQKWILTSNGYIELDSHDSYVLGSSEEFRDGALILLGSSVSSSTTKSIEWKFSVPVFGKKTTSTIGTKVSTAYDITNAIKNGDTIESTEDVASTQKSSLIVTHKTTKSTHTIYREFSLIISWWRIIFIRKLSTCRTQKEYLETVEQYRQILYSRFSHYLSVYGSSVSHQQRRLLEKSIEETKSIIEAKVFTKSITYLKTLKSDQAVSSKDFNFADVVYKACGTVDEKYKSHTSEATKESDSTKKQTSSELIAHQKQSESEVVENVLVIVDTIQITVRYWFKTIYRRISEASKSNATSEDIHKLVKESYNELQTELNNLNQSATTTLNGSKLHKEDLDVSVSSIIEKTKTEVGGFVSNIETSVSSTEEWSTAIATIENNLTKEFYECKNSVCQHSNSSELSHKQSGILVQEFTEEDIESSKIDIVTTLAESKAYISSWFSTVSNDISWVVNSQEESIVSKDVITIVEAAELDIIAKIDESLDLINVLSSRLTYLSLVERRRLVTYYISMRSYIITNVKMFKKSITNSDNKSTIIQQCNSAFGKEEQAEVLKNIETILENVTTTTQHHSSHTTIIDSITDHNSESKNSPDVNDTVTIGIIAEGEHTVSTIEGVENKSGTVTVDISKHSSTKESECSTKPSTVVIGDEKKSSEVVVIKEDSHSITVGTVPTTTEGKADVSIITQDAGSITVGAIHTEQEGTVEEIIKDQKSVTIGVITGDKKTESTHSDYAKNNSKVIITEDQKAESESSVEKSSSGHIEAVAGGIIAGGIIAGTISGHKEHKDTVSKVDVITKDSEVVSVIVGDKKTEQSHTDVVKKDSDSKTCEVVVDHKDTSKVDVITKESEVVTIGVIAGDKKNDKHSTEQKDHKDTSKVDVITKESEVVTIGIVSDNKKTEKHTSGHVDAVAGGIIAGGIIAGGIIAGTISGHKDHKDTVSKVDVITKDSEVVSVVVGNKKTEQSHTDVIKKDSDSKTSEVVVDHKDTSKVDVITKESEVVTIGVIAGDKKTDKHSTEHKDHKDTSKVDVITKESEVVTIGVVSDDKKTEKHTSGHVEAVAGGIIVGGIIAGTTHGHKEHKDTVSKVDVVTKDSEVVSVIVDDKKTEQSHTDVVKKDSDSKTCEVVVDHKDTSKVDVITKESEVVTIGVIAGDKKTDKHSTQHKNHKDTSKVDVITKESEVVTIGVVSDDKKTEKHTSGHVEAVAGGIIAGGIIAGTTHGHKEHKDTVSKVDVITKDSEVVSVIVGDKKTESSHTDIGKKGTDSKTCEVVVDHKDTSKVDVITKESKVVTIGVIAGDKKTDKHSTQHKDHKDTSKVDVITKESEVVTIGVVSDDKKTEKHTSDHVEAVAGGIIAGGIIAGTISGHKEHKDTSKVDVITKDSEVVSVIVGDKKTEQSHTDVVKKDSDSKTSEVVVDHKDTSKVDVITKESEVVTIGVIAGDKKTDKHSTQHKDHKDTSKVDVITKESEVVTIGVVSDDKKTEKHTSGHVEAVAGGIIAGGIVAGIISGHKEHKDTVSKVDVITKDSEVVSVIVGDKKTEQSHTDVVKKDSDSKTIEVVVDHKDTSKVDVITKESEVVTIGVIAGDKKTDKHSTEQKDHKDTSKVDVIAKESEVVTIGVISGDSKTEKHTSGHVEAVAGGIIAGGIIAGTISGHKEHKDTSKVDVITKESEVVSVIVDDKKTEQSHIDVVKKDSDSKTCEVVVDHKDTSKVDVITKESEVVTIGVIAGDKKTDKHSTEQKDHKDTSKVDVITKESEVVTIGVVSDDKKTEKHTSGHVEAVAGGIIAGGIIAGGIIAGTTHGHKEHKDTVSKVDVVTKDSEVVSVIVGDKKTGQSHTDVVKKDSDSKTVEVVVDHKDTSKVDVITKESEVVTIGVVSDDKKTEKHTSGHVEAVAGGIIAGGIIAGTISGHKEHKDTVSKVDVITKDSEVVSVIVGDKKTEQSHTDIGKKGTDSKTCEVVVDHKDTSKVDVITKESEVVTIGVVSDDKKTEKHTSGHVEAVAGGIIAGGIIAGTISAHKDHKDTSKVDVITKESEVVSVIVDDKKTEQSHIDVVKKDFDSKTCEVVVDHKDTSKVDVITKESEVVTIGVIAGDKKTDEHSAEHKDHKDTSKVDVITKESEVVTIGVVSDDKKTEKHTSGHVEAVAGGIIAGGIIAGGIIAGTTHGHKEHKDTVSKVDVITKDSEVVCVIVGDKKTESSHSDIGKKGTDSKTCEVVVDHKDTSKVDVITKESEVVTVGVIAGDKKIDKHSTEHKDHKDTSKVDVITKESEVVTIGVVSDDKKTEKHTSGHVETVAGGIIAGGIIAGTISGHKEHKDTVSKVDVITKDSEVVSVIVGDKKTGQSHTDVVKKDSDSKTSEVVVDHKDTSKVDVITKESEVVTIGVVSDDKKTEKHTSGHVEAVAGGIIVGGIIAGTTHSHKEHKDTVSKVDVVTKDSEVVSVIVGDKKTEQSHADVVKKDSDSKTIEVVVDHKDTSKVDVITKESEVVTIGVIAGDKKTDKHSTEHKDHKDTSKVDVITKESEVVTIGVVSDDKKTEKHTSGHVEVVAGGIIAGGIIAGGIIAGTTHGHKEHKDTVSKVDVITKDSEVVCVIVGDKKTESSHSDIGKKGTDSKTCEVVVDHKDTSKVDVITKESEVVTVGVIAGDKKIDKHSTEHKDHKDTSKVDVITKESEVVTIGVVSDDKKSEKHTSDHVETVAGGIIAGGIIAGTISGHKEHKDTSKVDVITKESEVVSVIVGDKKTGQSHIDVVKKDSDSKTCEVVVDHKDTSKVDVITKESEVVTIGVIAGDKKTDKHSTEQKDHKDTSKVDVITKESEVVTIGVVSDDKKTEKHTSGHVEAVAGGIIAGGIIAGGIIAGTTHGHKEHKDTVSKVDVVTKDSEVVCVIVGDKKTGQSHTDVVKKDSGSKTVEVVVDHKDTSKVDVITKESEVVTIGVIAGDKKTDKHSTEHKDRKDSSKVDVITKESEVVTIGVVSDDKKTEKHTSGHVETVAGGIIAGGIIAGTISGHKEHKDTSKVDVITKESEVVSVIVDDKKTEQSHTDVVKKDSDSKTIEVVVDHKDTSKVDVITKESEVVTIGVIAGDKKTDKHSTEQKDHKDTSKVDVITKESEVVTIGVVSDEKKTEKHTSGYVEAVAGGIIAGGIIAGTISGHKEHKDTSKVDVITKESEVVTIGVIAGDKKTDKHSTEHKDHKDTSKVDVITKESEVVTIGVVSDDKKTEKHTSGHVEAVAGGIIAGGIIAGTISAHKDHKDTSKVDFIIKDSEVVSVIVGDKKTEQSHTDVIKKDSDSKTCEVVVDHRDTSKVDVITKESEVVTVGVIAGDKKTDKHSTEHKDHKDTSKVDVITKESEVVTIGVVSDDKKTEKHTSGHVEAVAGGIIAGGIIAGTISAHKDHKDTSKVDVITKDSEVVSVIVGDKKTEQSHTDVIKKDSDSKTSEVVVDHKDTSKVDVITKESEVVTIGVIAGDKKTDKHSTEHKDHKDTSKVDVITKESEVVTIGVVSDDKKTEKHTSGHVEAVAGGIIVGGIIAGTTHGHKEHKDTVSKVDVVIKDSEVVSVIVDDKKTEQSHTDVVKKDSDSKTSEVVVDHKDTSKVDVITKESEVVTIGVIAGDKKTDKHSTQHKDHKDTSKVDVITKESEVVTIGVVSDDKKTEKHTSGHVEAVAGGIIAGGIIAGTISVHKDHKDTSKVDFITKGSEVVSVIVGDKKTEQSHTDVIKKDSDSKTVEVVVDHKDTSKVDVITKESEVVTIGVITGDKKTDKHSTQHKDHKDTSKVDVITKESEVVTIGVISGDSKTEKHTSGHVEAVAGGIIAGGIIAGGIIAGTISGHKEHKDTVSKVDVITKDSEVVSVIVGDKKTESSHTDVVKKDSGSKTVEVVVDHKDTSKVDVITKESEFVTIGVIAGDKKTDKHSTEHKDRKDSSKVDVITKESEVVTIGVISGDSKTDKHTSGHSHDNIIEQNSESVSVGVVAGGIIAGGIIAGNSCKNSITAHSEVDTHKASGSVEHVGEDVLVSGEVVTSDGKSVTIVDKSEVLVTGEVAVNIIKVSEGKKMGHKPNTVVVSKEKLSVEGAKFVQHFEETTENAYDWFIRFIEKVTSMIEIGDCVEDVNATIVEEETKLQVILDKSKKELSTGAVSSSAELAIFYDKLQWSIESQIKSIKYSVDEAYAQDSKVSHKIDLHAAKTDFKKLVSVHLTEAKSEVYKNSTVSTSEVTVVGSKPNIEVVKGETAVVTKPIEQISKTTVIYKSIEDAQNETQKVLTCAVETTKSRFAIWYDNFFNKIRSITVSSSDVSYKREVEKIVQSSLEEANIIIKESKSAFEFEYSVSDKASSTEIVSVVKNSQKQAVESLDNIYTIVAEQVSSIQEVIISGGVKSSEEKISLIEEQSRRRTSCALESTTETAIAAGFEGKTITWVETAQIPDSFKGVKVFAFDLVDSIVNYRASISKAWYLVVSKKSACKFAQIDVQKLIVRWYNLYLEHRLKAKHSESDTSILLIALRLVLVEFSLKSEFTEAELLTLCSAWLKIELFEDASASIRKIKQLDGVYAVAISHAFTIRTMMDLARNGCLCWHAQFTADMFAACTINNGTSEEVTVVSNTAMLLGLNNASELAVVSSNPKVLMAARKYGSKTVLIDRYNEVNLKENQSFDIEFSALDIFSESFETFYETKVVCQKVQVPVTRSWFQRVVTTVTETAESVSHAIIG